VPKSRSGHNGGNNKISYCCLERNLSGNQNCQVAMSQADCVMLTIVVAVYTELILLMTSSKPAGNT